MKNVKIVRIILLLWIYLVLPLNLLRIYKERPTTVMSFS